MTQGAAGEHSPAGVAGGLPATRSYCEVHPCPAHHLPGSSTRSVTSSSSPPCPAPLQARPWPPKSRSALRERAAARRSSRASGGGGLAPTMSVHGLAAWPPPPDSVGLASPCPLRGAQCVCLCQCLCRCPCRLVCVVCDSRKLASHRPSTECEPCSVIAVPLATSGVVRGFL